MGKWIKSSDRKPPHNKTVLIFLSGNFHIGYYDKYALHFRLNDGRTIPAEQKDLQWTEITAPAT